MVQADSYTDNNSVSYSHAQTSMYGVCAPNLATATAIQFLPPTAAADPVAATALVLEVVDGDTIDIRDDNRGHLRVRS